MASVEYDMRVADAGLRHPSLPYQPAAPVCFLGKPRSTDTGSCSWMWIDLHWGKQLRNGGVAVSCLLRITMISSVTNMLVLAVTKKLTELFSTLSVKRCSLTEL